MSDPGLALTSASFIAEGAEAAPADTVPGPRTGPAGTALATALAAADRLLPAMADVLVGRATPANRHYQAR